MEKREKKNIKLAIIDNSINSEIYDPLEHWGPFLNTDWTSYKATKSHFPRIQDGYTHLLLTGSEASILERENWVHEEIEVVQQAVEKGVSILGSCYGHQLLALALAGSAHTKKSERPEVGWISVDIKETNNILGPEKRAYSFSIHFDEVVNLRVPFLILASSKHCRIQAFQWREKPVWGIQIHPEIGVSAAQKLLRTLIDQNLVNKALFREALESKPRDSKLIYPIVRAFLKPRKNS
jgi:GMP synthase-like glutamine amidotransferase